MLFSEAIIKTFLRHYKPRKKIFSRHKDNLFLTKTNKKAFNFGFSILFYFSHYLKNINYITHNKIFHCYIVPIKKTILSE